MDECKPLIAGRSSCFAAEHRVHIMDMSVCCFKAGAYTRSLSSSTSAVPYPKYTLSTPKYPVIPPKHPLGNPYMHTLSHRKRLR